MRQRNRRRLAVWLLGPVAALSVGAALSVTAASGAPGAPTFTIPGGGNQLGDLPVNPQWLVNTLQRASTTTSVKNNTSPEARSAVRYLARRPMPVTV